MVGEGERKMGELAKFLKLQLFISAVEIKTILAVHPSANGECFLVEWIEEFLARCLIIASTVISFLNFSLSDFKI